MPRTKRADPNRAEKLIRVDLSSLTQEDLKRLPRIGSKLTPGHPAFLLVLREAAIQRQRDVDWEGLEEAKNEVSYRLQKVVEARDKGSCHTANSKSDSSQGVPK